jgi:aminoglycoside phosphotransferase (APT) family kinase protein
MPVQSPPSPRRVSAELGKWLGDRFGGQVREVESPGRASGGFDFWIYFLHLEGSCLPAEWTGPLVARMSPTPERFALLERESRLQSWSAKHGYPTPRVLAVLEPGELFDSPVQIVERVPGHTMTTAMTTRPWHIPRLLDRLAGLQARLHVLTVPDWTGPGSEWSLAERRLGLVRFVLDRVAHSEIASGLERVEQLLPLLNVADPVICHGDFHPMNLLVDGDTTSVIDWTDAGVGDRHGDIARTAWLFRFASVAAPRRAERVVLRPIAPVLSRRYLSFYRRHLPVDVARIQLWMPLQLLHSWTMAVVDELELSGPSRADNELQPGLSEWAKEQFLLSLEALP